MTDEDLYIYDVQGYLLLEDAIPPEQLAAIDTMYDRRLDDAEALRQTGTDTRDSTYTPTLGPGNR